MTQNDKELLIRDLCARLHYGVIVHLKYDENTSVTREMGMGSLHDIMFDSAEGKPYLRPLSSMTEEEARVFGTLHDIKNILSVKVTNEYIDYIVDDGFSSTLITTLWYDELISSVECLDWLNSKHFDYRGLILKGLAIAVTEENNPYK